MTTVKVLLSVSLMVESARRKEADILKGLSVCAIISAVEQVRIFKKRRVIL